MSVFFFCPHQQVYPCEQGSLAQKIHNPQNCRTFGEGGLLYAMFVRHLRRRAIQNLETSSRVSSNRRAEL